jgi:hypothetical protein
MSAAEQLVLPLDRLLSRDRDPLDHIRAALEAQQQRALDEALRAKQAAPTCRCAPPLREGGACLKCGKDINHSRRRRQEEGKDG